MWQTMREWLQKKERSQMWYRVQTRLSYISRRKCEHMVLFVVLDKLVIPSIWTFMSTHVFISKHQRILFSSLLCCVVCLIWQCPKVCACCKASAQKTSSAVMWNMWRKQRLHQHCRQVWLWVLFSSINFIRCNQIVKYQSTLLCT